MNYRTTATLLALLCTAGVSLAEEEVYKTTDKYGNVIYSDVPIPTRPDETTEKVQVRETNTMPATERINLERRSPRQEDPASEHPDYNVRIVSPTHETTVPPGQRDLIIAVSTDYPLKKGARFAYYMDGELLGRETVNNFSIHEIIRGAHNLVVKVESQEGEVISTSESVTVFVHRASIR